MNTHLPTSKKGWKNRRNHSLHITIAGNKYHLLSKKMSFCQWASLHCLFSGIPYWLDHRRGVPWITIWGSPFCMFVARRVDRLMHKPCHYVSPLSSYTILKKQKVSKEKATSFFQPNQHFWQFLSSKNRTKTAACDLHIWAWQDSNFKKSNTSFSQQIASFCHPNAGKKV